MIRDLLWGCVVCGELESIQMVDRIETCAKCGARYKRARGSSISVEVQGRGIETRSAAEWTAQLPPVALTGSAECLLRQAESDMPVTQYGEYVGRVERFGNFRFGTLTVTDRVLRFDPRDDDDGFEWPLSEITAVQPSSTALQIKAKRRPVVSIKFASSSSRLWEERLQSALRHYHSGREIIEFQPRVVFK